MQHTRIPTLRSRNGGLSLTASRFPRNSDSVSSTNEFTVAGVDNLLNKYLRQTSSEDLSRTNGYDPGEISRRNSRQNLADPDVATEGIVQQAIAMLPFIPNILIKLGARGVLSVRLCPKDSEVSGETSDLLLRSKGVHGDVIMRYYPGLKHQGIVSVTGAGYFLRCS